MNLTLLASLLPLLAGAIPTSSSTPPPAPSTAPPGYPPGPFTVLSARSASPVHLYPMQASNQHFFLGGRPNTYCPLQLPERCPRTNSTVIEGLAELSVVVAGGQHLYVEPSGALGFARPDYPEKPAGSVETGFTYTPGTEHGKFGFHGLGADGFMACPGHENGLYQVFAAMWHAEVPTGNIDDCLGFVAMAIPYEGETPAAWQYV
ncbi:hypothetical protein FQN52_007960 [Onygenales sp. PD_12]|nr:hypothetical protein FQN52_007960 [Onygenales sp. PD_12]